MRAVNQCWVLACIWSLVVVPALSANTLPLTLPTSFSSTANSNASSTSTSPLPYQTLPPAEFYADGGFRSPNTTTDGDIFHQGSMMNITWWTNLTIVDLWVVITGLGEGPIRLSMGNTRQWHEWRVDDQGQRGKQWVLYTTNPLISDDEDSYVFASGNFWIRDPSSTLTSYTASSAAPSVPAWSRSVPTTAAFGKQVTKGAASDSLSVDIGAGICAALAIASLAVGGFFVLCIRRRKTSWLATATMLAFLLLGIDFALGHHVFYQSLEGTKVSNGESYIVGFNVSRQEVSTAIGTAFAFLVKACLVGSVTVAFTQLFWQAAKCNAQSKPPTLGHLDVLSIALSDVTALFSIRVWWRYPLLLLAATAAWLIPVASIITPATLSVQTAMVFPVPVHRVAVPNLDFRDLDFLAPMPAQLFQIPQWIRYQYNGPSQAVSAIVSAAMASGHIQPIEAPAPNASYSLEFMGPHIKCEPASDELHRRFRRDVAAWVGLGACQTYPGYMAWPNQSSWFGEQWVSGLPFLGTQLNGTSLGLVTDTWGSPMPMPFGLGNTFFVATTPSVLKLSASGSELCNNHLFGLMPKDLPSPLPDEIDGQMHQCRLGNATYHVNFTYVNNQQHIEHRVSDFHIVTWEDELYLGIEAGRPCSGISPYYNDSLVCWSYPGVMQRMAYQAISDAFTTQIAGIVTSHYGYAFYNSSVLGTALGSTKELIEIARELVDRHPSFQINHTLPGLFANLPSLLAQGLYSPTESQHPPLIPFLEDLFQKVTISLMSSKLLQANYTSVTAPSPVNVTYTAFDNFYFYYKWKLWSAYAPAILLTVIIAALGLAAVISERKSYTQKFSTTLRAISSAHVQTSIEEKHLDGADPLPDYLRDASVTFESAEKPTIKQALRTLHTALDDRLDNS